MDNSTETINDTELRPCPFCGGKAKLRERTIELPMSEEKNVFFVMCTQCGCSPFEFGEVCLYYKHDSERTKRFIEHRAIEAWNRRTKDGE